MKRRWQKLAGWGGYTMEQLRYERAMTEVRIELEKERLAHGGRGGRRLGATAGHPTWQRLAAMLSYADYVVLGVKLWRRLAPLFGRGKAKS